MHPTLLALKDIIPNRELRALELWTDEMFSFQRDWILEQRKLAAGVKCRQIGWSFTMGGGWPVFRGAFSEDTVLVSIRDNEAKDLLDQAEKHALVLESLGSHWMAPKKKTTHSLILRSGAEITSTTSTAAGRGFTGNVLLDEFAYMQNQEATWDSALAATTHGYQCRIGSTPNGAGDIWHQVCNELGSPNPVSEKQWKIWSVSIHDAIADGMNVDMEQCWEMARNDPRLFAQLFECKFLDGNLQYIPHELIRKQITDQEPDMYAESFGGIDIGETRDRTSLVILRGDKGRIQLSHCETHGKTDDQLIDLLVDKAINVYGCSRVCIDKTGMGTFPSQRAVRKHGIKVEPVLFGAKQKEAMAGRLYQSLAEGLLWIPKGQQDVVDDVMSIKRMVTEAGTVRFDAPRTAKGHADRAWALMLALQASSLAGVKDAYSNMRKIHKAPTKPTDGPLRPGF